MDTTLLDNLIIGRVDPYIYAFETNTIPNYLKVGDTYRPLETRLDEWRMHYPDLIEQYRHSAVLSSGHIFRDHAVHEYLEHKRGFNRLLPTQVPFGVYYSKEFFKDAKGHDIDDAIVDIETSEQQGGGRYTYYDASRLPIQISYQRTKTFPPRDNQQSAIDKFKDAVDKGRTNLLMYAVMRFGKSFTAMCCATEMKANFVLIVSAKADVRQEWKETVESHIRFKDYEYMDSSNLLHDYKIISNSLASGKKVALFLTLEDLQGDEIKAKHQDVFMNNVDLLIVDETHFGARAEEYGKVLRTYNLKSKEYKNEEKEYENSEEFDKQVKQIKSKVRLHLSGTPYRILMGDEFTKDDIIAFCQYTDIIDAKENWDRINGNDDDVQEWDNPYYGFPQMVRFAFHPNQATLSKMRELKEKGITYAFSALFRPKSLIKSSTNEHKQFVYEKEILDLFRIIDGSKTDDNILGFLDYDRIQNGQMCHHIVIVLPFRASCDALQELIKYHSNDFRNLSKYQIINIAGVDDERTYRDIESVKAKIKDCEERGIRTITLTVNRMLTGSTVPYWDTMIYMKDTASAQEYDQSIFRIQNQYIKVYRDENDMEIRYNMKPQTLLVDFDPDRMFRMQELKSQFYNVNIETNGNNKLRERIDRELIISPIFTINHNKLVQVEAKDVMAVVQQYSQNKSILDEASDIPFDSSLLEIESVRAEIEAMKEIDAPKGLEFSPIEGDGDSDFKIPDTEGNSTSDKPTSSSNPIDKEDDDITSIMKKLAAYYAKILFYAFLTENEVATLQDIINSIAGENIDNRRIAKNLGLRVPILCAIQSKGNPFAISKLDYKIQNINTLMRDNDLTPLARAKHAMTRFARISDTEVVTPHVLASELISLIPEDGILGQNILDISSVQAELVCALHEKYGDGISHHVFSVPTSPLTYELTRKIYSLLGEPIEHILPYYSRAILQADANLILDLQSHNFKTIIGVPPFGERIGGGRDDGTSAIYHHFFNFAKDQLHPTYIAMMMQSTWYAGGRGEGLQDFRDYMLSTTHIQEMHDYPDVENYTRGVTTLRGGVCLFIWNVHYNGACYFINKLDSKHEYPMNRSLRYTHGDFSADFLIRWNEGLSILKKVLDKESHFIPDNNLMRNRNAFGFPNESSDNWLIGMKKSASRKTKVYLSKGKVGYALDREFTKEKMKGELLDQWKVLIAKSSSGGDTLPHLVISEPIVSEPGSATANTHYVICGVNSKKEATNLRNYMRTRFFRFMVNLLRSNQNMRVDMYQFAPRLDFSRSWTDDELYLKYGITSKEQEFIKLVVKDMDTKRKSL